MKHCVISNNDSKDEMDLEHFQCANIYIQPLVGSHCNDNDVDPGDELTPLASNLSGNQPLAFANLK